MGAAKTSAKKANRSVALLRGINVGGKHSVPMKELSALFTKCGCSEVATYIQSGNVVFCTTASSKLDAAMLATRIEKTFGFPVPVILRTAEELEAAVRRNPFPKADPDKERMHVSFLASEPTAAQIASLDPNRSPGDTFKVLGREIYLLLPNGAGNSKLTNAYFDSKLKTTSTARNWRTVLKLLEMSRA
ncbi:MAG TPA: DUF1697 domain-containing protein [Candidatus Acidoferrales bacterium]